MKLHLTPYQILTTWPTTPTKDARGAARPRVRNQKPLWEQSEPSLEWPIMAPTTPNHLVMMWGM